MMKISLIPRGGLSVALAVTLFCVAPLAAEAAICNITSVSAINTVYDETIGSDSVTTGSWSMICTREASDAAATFNWSVGANNGTHAAGAQPRAAFFFFFFLNYEPYRIVGGPYNAANRWADACGGTPTRFTGTLTWTGGTGSTVTVTRPFDLRIQAGQNPLNAPYTDTITLTPRAACPSVTALGSTGSMSVTIYASSRCAISVPPGNVNFTYTSFQGTASNASTTYGVSCTNGLPYTMRLDGAGPPFSYSLLGLTYTLALPASATGTGLTQTHTINGSIAAGQSGTCATAVCNGTQTRTLTISW
jgi:spore coat protein U-like protein